MDEDARLELSEERRRKRIVVRDGAPWEPLSRRILRSEYTRRLDRYGLTLPGPEDPDVRVTPALLPRAARILDALLAAFRERGWPVERRVRQRPGLFHSQAVPAMCVVLFGVDVPICLREKLERESPRSPSNHRFGYMQPTGQLRLQIGEHRGRELTGDRSRAALEEQLNKFMEWMIRFAAGRRAAELTRFAQAREAAAAWRELRHRHARDRKEQRRTADAWRALRDWRRADELRRLAKQLQSVAEHASGSSRRVLFVQAFAQRLRSMADACDPVSRLNRRMHRP